MTKTSPITLLSVKLHGDAYHLRRRGSRYNILGPQGRIFATYQSAGVAGPRWEELTLTPWPQPSSAYQPGSRLAALRPIPPAPAAPVRPRPPAIPLSAPPLALPAPRLDLAAHAALMQRLRRQPALLFTPIIRRALRHEVEYHRPQAAWAAHLLALLARYDARQRARQRSHVPPAPLVLAKHLAWQEARAAIGDQRLAVGEKTSPPGPRRK